MKRRIRENYTDQVRTAYFMKRFTRDLKRSLGSVDVMVRSKRTISAKKAYEKAADRQPHSTANHALPVPN